MHEKNTSLDPTIKLNAKPLKSPRVIEVKKKVDHFNFVCRTCKGTGTIEKVMNKKIHLALCPDCSKIPEALL